ncbi:pentapeptide repeat-containing protein [Leucobacter sp. gxy201]|uniref:pentapeptide repeat-containing protein n=1 Tax=Leucobacter sp. gxy201 TaxID=2957200 RepID=UPI003DA0AB10
MRRAAVRVQEPHLDEHRLDRLAEAGAGEPKAGGSYEALRFTGSGIGRASLVGTTFTECEIVDWGAERVELQGARLIETRISRIDVPHLTARRSTWRDVEMLSSRTGAVDGADSALHRVLFEGAKLGWAGFRAAELHDVTFRDCRIDELDLSMCTIARVAFENTTVHKLVLSGAQARHLDLRGIELGSIDGIEGLRGAVLTRIQAAEMTEIFAAHLGIAIEE